MRRIAELGILIAVALPLLCAGSAWGQTGNDAAPDAPAAKPQAADDDAEPDEGEEEEVKLPKLDEMTLPSAAELLTGPRRDWIVLKTDEVIVCEPLFPRPDTLAKMQAKIDAYPSFRGVRTPEALAEYRRVFDDLHHLNIVLGGEEDEPEYRLHMRYVGEIRHHEDLMLRRVDALIDEGKYRDAFEMLFVLERSRSGWPGYKERRERLLFLEAGKNFADNKAETALVALEELHAANPKFGGLKNQLGDVTERLIDEALAGADYRRARHFLLRLKSREEAHTVVAKWTEALLGESAAAVQRAEELYAAGELAAAVDASELAVRIWPNMPGQPTTPNLTSVYNRFNNRYQRLRVGVVELPGLDFDGVPPGDADERRRYLTQTTLFEVDHSDDSPHFRSRLLEQWEPTDLGRRVTFTLRQNRSGWEPQPLITATSIMSSFEARLDPFGALYDERLAGFVSSVAVISPFEFEVQLSRVPPRIESLLTFPVTGDPPPVANEKGHKRELLSRRFVLAEQTPDRAVYRRATAEPDGSNQFHVAEVVERLYPSYEKAVQGLLRGEVSMLPRVDSRDVPLLQADSRLQVVETALPVTHLLQFNPHSRVTTNRELRRALAYGINRGKVLEETVLDDPNRARGRLVSGPFATQGLSAGGHRSQAPRRVRGYAYNAQVEPRRYDPTLAASLYLAAAKQFEGDVPELRLLCVADPVAEEAARQLVRHWAAAGIRVRLVSDALSTGTAKPQADWDIVYRIVRLTEPVVDLWPLLTLEPTARVESLAFLPDWLLQELIELDRAGDWKSAVSRLHRLHAHLAAEAILIPLWEVDDYVVTRRTIRGYPEPPLFAYQHIERWTVRPWFATDAP